MVPLRVARVDCANGRRQSTQGGRYGGRVQGIGAVSWEPTDSTGKAMLKASGGNKPTTSENEVR